MQQEKLTRYKQTVCYNHAFCDRLKSVRKTELFLFHSFLHKNSHDLDMLEDLESVVKKERG